MRSFQGPLIPLLIFISYQKSRFEVLLAGPLHSTDAADDVPPFAAASASSASGSISTGVMAKRLRL